MDFIFDIDNTLSCSKHREYLLEVKDREEYYSRIIHDPVVESTRLIANALYNSNNTIIICTGRPEKYRDLTRRWLEANDIKYHDLYMRQPSFQYVKNAEAKRIMLEQIKLANFNPIAVFEDNTLSSQMWLSQGLIVYEVKK